MSQRARELLPKTLLGTARLGLGVWPSRLQGTHLLGPPKLGILSLEQIELLGKEDSHHEQQEKHKSSRADGHAHHLEVGDDGLTAHAFVPDVVLGVTPTGTDTEGLRTGQAILAPARTLL